jgi:hypothetical protein
MREYTVQTFQNSERPQRGYDGEKVTMNIAKVLVTCRVTLFGLGTHSGTGEEWATDQNALTLAKPLLALLKSRVEAARAHAPSSSALGKAATYTLALWPKLTRFLEHPEVE